MAHQSKKREVGLFSPAQDVKCWAIVLIGFPVKHGPRVEVSLLPMSALWGHWASVSIGWPIRAMYSWVWPPIKEDSGKGIDRLKAGSADGRLEALATLFATTSTLPIVLNLTVPSNIILLKTDSRLTVIASQLISELKALVVVVVVVVHNFFIIVQ